MMMDKGSFFAGHDRYLHHDHEDALFFWDHRTRKVWMKFVGQSFDVEVLHDQRLFNEAIAGGREISRSEYEAGKAA